MPDRVRRSRIARSGIQRKTLREAHCFSSKRGEIAAARAPLTT
jgi:hypothetical protein